MASHLQTATDAAERRSARIGVGAALIIVLVIYGIWLLPVQPSQDTTAKVVSIRPYFSRYYSGDQVQVTVRNEHGFGQFLVRSAAARCSIGDTVPVVQTGIRLSPTNDTCTQQQD